MVIPGFGTVEGPFQITGLEYAGSYNGEATYELSLASAGALSFLAVAVIDNRGRLDIGHIHGGLDSARQRATIGLPEGLATAGLGFRIMLDSLSQMVVNIEPDKRTEIIGIVDLGKTLKEYRKTAPSLGMFRRPT